MLKIFNTSPQFKEIAVAKGTIYEYWSADDKELRCLAFPIPGVVAMGQRAPVEKALTAEQGGHLTDTPDYAAQLKDSNPTALFRLIVPTTVKLTAANPFADGLRKSVRAFRASAEVTDGVKLDLNLAAVDPGAAELWRDMLKGALAAGQMVDQMPLVNTMAKRVKLETNEANVAASLDASIAEALDLLALNPKFKQLREKKQP